MFNMTQRSVLIAVVTYLVINAFIDAAFQKPTIATVDIVAITSEFIKKEAQKNHSEPEKKAAIQAFSHRLETALTVLAKKKNIVLLPREAVIKGGVDYTQQLENMIAVELKP
jgi:hypothetical protein